MAMPRPSGKAQKIAEKVIPGLQKEKKVRLESTGTRGSMSEVETRATNGMNNDIYRIKAKYKG
jgi:hypothetical protein